VRRDHRDPALDARLPKFTGNTVVDLATLAEELERIRARGWAQQSAEFEGDVSSIAAVIPRSDGENSHAAIVLFGPTSRLTIQRIEQLAPLVVHAAAEVAHRVR
jgi:DNA-binding IclR family transcriptional regulator